ncbi:hypothetical protein LOC71_06495 [Rhodopirellula sp. JC740]|uniref:Uncharacterized protein n=1 Tax=Rhodopirellula halodulae TaxID=2894198 RepID=A0ABS8NG43_9BACT|nr:hypothetical protein [Rhodopirellula sp. JC740]MCC9641917.1 hypothetical protein [Rhodopirellula sp. JC740]
MRLFETASAGQDNVQQVIDNARASNRAVMFIDVDWAMTEIYHQQFAEFAVEYFKKHPTDSLRFHFADCTAVSKNYASLRAIPGWTTLMDDAGTAMIHGHGEIAWLADGHVLRVQKIADFATPSELIESTEDLLPADG